MGMAASQARYLALVARKSNCEYEGQQINEARTALSNQSANLFNQMLGLNVPVPPSTQDYTKTQYSYSDGFNSSTISSWQQLSNTDPDYNYVVTHHYYTDRYTGSMKMLSDPQVQFAGTENATVAELSEALATIEATEQALTEAKEEVKKLQEEMAKITSYADTTAITEVTDSSYDSATNRYDVTNGGNNIPFYNYANAPDDLKTLIDSTIQKLVENGALDKKYLENKSDIYFTDDGNIAFKDDLDNLLGGSYGSTKTSLPIYSLEDVNAKLGQYATQLVNAELAVATAQRNKNEAVDRYENVLIHPTYIGNSELTLLTELDKEQETELKQILADMQEQNIDTNLQNCFDDAGNYRGGVYSFKLNGITYYTTFTDLQNSYASGDGNNYIDAQIKLPYYNATYVSTKIEETEKALLETDGNGRFVSVRFENDSVKYVLNMETVTDDAAYQDAMNEYYYENALYDKMVQDINAKTSIIHQQDQQLELRLKQLDTEQKALSTEMEAVKKVVDDNVEKSFKTFNG